MKPNKKYSFYLFLTLALIIPVIVFSGYYWYREKVEALPYFGIGYTLEEGNKSSHYTVANIELLDEQGVNISLNKMGKAIKVVNLFFADCPTVCPRMMENMKLLQNSFQQNNQVHLLSITVNPENDSVPILNAYAKQRHINSKFWTLATGDKKAIYQFARNGIFLVANQGDGGTSDFIHSDKLVLLDQNNHIRGYYDGGDRNDIKKLVTDIKRLQ